MNQYSIVCSAHFQGGRKAGKKDIPSVFGWTKKASRQPPKDRATNVTSQGSYLSEEDAELSKDFSCNPETVDLEGMIDKVLVFTTHILQLRLKPQICQ